MAAAVLGRDGRPVTAVDGQFRWIGPQASELERRWFEEIAALTHEAGNPYHDWFFGGFAAAEATLREWTARPTAEVYVGRSTALVAGRDLAGFYIAMSGRDLARARLSDVAAARRALGDADLRERVAAAQGLFGPVDADDWYLSVIAVAPTFRRRGIGRQLLDRYVEAGASAGHSRFTLDVDARRDAANALYASAGFREYHRGTTVDGALEYRSLVRD